MTVITASEAQCAANRANAQLSTGPTSLAGKAISSRNNTRHGLTGDYTSGGFKVLAHENQGDYDRSLEAFSAEWQPVTATELDLVNRMVTHSWLRNRAQSLQDHQIAAGMETMQDVRLFEGYGRYYNTHLRAFNKAFSDLMRLRTFQLRQKKDEASLVRHAQEVEIRFESQKRKAAEHAAKMEGLHLKLEAQKQRNQRLTIAETNAAPTATTNSATAAAVESGS